LSLAMREGTNPAAVFDELRRRGQIIVADTPEKAQQHIAAQAATTLLAGRSHSVVAATNEQAEQLNTAIRDRLVAAGRVQDTVTVTGMDGLRIGVGDTITTRANSTEHHVANRDTWTVTKVDPAGVLTITGPVDGHTRTLPPAYVQTSVQLGYATTGHGAQGATTDAATTLHTEHTDAAGQYVAMTRGRLANTAVLIAGNDEQARTQWVAAAGRDRADRGLEAARTAARIQAQQYQATPTPTPAPQTSPQVGHPPGWRVPAAPEPTQPSESVPRPQRTAVQELLEQIRHTDISADTPLSPATQQLYEKLRAQNVARRQELVQQYRQALDARIATLTSKTERYTAQVQEREQARAARIEADRQKAVELKPVIQAKAVQVERLRAASGMDAPPVDQPHIIGSRSVAQNFIDRAADQARLLRQDLTRQVQAQLEADRRVLEQAARTAEQASVFRRVGTRRAAEQAQQRAAQVHAEAAGRWGKQLIDPRSYGQDREEGIKKLVDQQPAVATADQAVDNATAKLTYITAAQELHTLRQQLHSLEPDPVRDREARTAADIAALSWRPDPAIAQQARDLQLLDATRTRSARLEQMTPAQQVDTATQWKTDTADQTAARVTKQIQDNIRRAQQQAAQRDRDRNHYEQQHHYEHDHGPSLGM